MAKIGLFRADLEREKEGIWVTYALDIELRIRRLNNPDYTKFLRRALTMGGRRRDENTEEKLENEAMAYYVLVDWKNILDEDEKEVPYSREQSLAYISNPEYFDFRTFVMTEAARVDNFMLANLEDTRGNLQNSSNGTSTSGSIVSTSS